MTSRSFFALFLAFGALAPRVASASASYPDEIKAQWHLPGSAPDCVVCHQTDLGGDGTSTKPFSRSLQRDGLVGNDLGSLDTALAASKSAMTDSDGDGISDYEELTMGSDPNDGPGSTFGDYPIPQTGCSVRAPGHAPSVVTWLLSLACAALLVRKRRR